MFFFPTADSMPSRKLQTVLQKIDTNVASYFHLVPPTFVQRNGRGSLLRIVENLVLRMSLTIQQRSYPPPQKLTFAAHAAGYFA